MYKSIQQQQKTFIFSQTTVIYDFIYTDVIAP